MPLFEFVFTDTSTIRVIADDAAAAQLHVETLLTIAKHTEQTPELKGKALAGGAPKQLKS